MQPLIGSPQNVNTGNCRPYAACDHTKGSLEGRIQEFVGKGAGEIWAITKIGGLRPKPGGIIEHFKKGIGNSQGFQCVNGRYEIDNKVQTMVSV